MASVVVKWSLPRLRTVLSLTDRFSSGRPWHNPERPGLMNDEVKPYNSLDVGLTFLPSKKVIVHASATNILGPWTGGLCWLPPTASSISAFS